MLNKKRERKRSSEVNNKGCRWFQYLLLFFCCGLILIGILYWQADAKRIVVAIDPGHGGVDVGAKGVVDEAQMNERTAKLLHQLFQSDKRFKPVYTRKFKSDVKYSLADRIALANKKKAKLLISIHGNSSKSNSVRGFECYASPPGRNNHDASLKLATLIAENMARAGHHLRGENGVRFMYYLKSETLKTRLDIRESSYDNAQRTEASMAMVENPECPAVLVEQCFVNNQADYEAWGSEAGAEKAAKVYYEAICEYLGLEAYAISS